MVAFADIVGSVDMFPFADIVGSVDMVGTFADNMVDMVSLVMDGYTLALADNMVAGTVFVATDDHTDTADMVFVAMEDYTVVVAYSP
jgi:hypothetical protein